MNDRKEALVPEVLHVFVNQASLVTRHNYDLTGRFISAGFGAAVPDARALGTIVGYGPGANAPRGDNLSGAFLDGSLDYLPFIPNEQYFGWSTPFLDNLVADYRVEYDAEVARRCYAPLAPSRLSAIYAFGDQQACTAVNQRYHWPISDVARFKLVPHELNRVARVNMEIVSLARTAYRQGMLSPADLDAIWRTYWTGGGGIQVEVPLGGTNREVLSSGVIWEYLVEGVLERESAD